MGSPRSGTTFLAQMVNRFFDVHICRDNGTILRFYRSVRHYEPLENDHNLKRLVHHLYADHYFKSRLRDRGFTLSEAELFARVVRRTYGGLVEAIFSATAESHGKRQWGYKRASFARVGGERLDDLFPGARLVHVIRDARDVVLSMRTAKDSLLERSWHFGAVDWVSHLQTGRRLGQQLGPERYLEVRYERFMAEPATVLLGILAFSGGGDRAGRDAARIRSEIGPLVRSGNTEKWRRVLPPGAGRTIERVAGDLLGELGYPVLYPDVVGRPVGAPEMAWLHVDRLARTLVQTRLGSLIRYRVEVLKAAGRARFSRGGEKR